MTSDRLRTPAGRAGSGDDVREERGRLRHGASPVRRRLTSAAGGAIVAPGRGRGHEVATAKARLEFLRSRDARAPQAGRPRGVATPRGGGAVGGAWVTFLRQHAAGALGVWTRRAGALSLAVWCKEIGDPDCALRSTGSRSPVRGGPARRALGRPPPRRRRRERTTWLAGRAHAGQRVRVLPALNP